MNTLPILAALQDYIEKIQEASDERFRTHHPNLWDAHKADKFFFTEGSKYFKIVHSFSKQTGVFCFVDKTNGDIYKAETWSRPAKIVRGSLFNKELPLTLGSLYIRH